MSLTISDGPLAAHAADSNYRIDGPAHRLFFQAFPRRVRAVFGGATVLDTRRGKLLHETGLLPQLYAPKEDMAFDLFAQTKSSTTCPFKARATYWSIEYGSRVAADAVWAYLDPRPEAEWLRGYAALYWERVDTWFDEEEQVFGRLRDPYHRVDVRLSSSRVRVRAEGELIAETTRPRLVSETGLPNRFYVPLEDIRGECLEPSTRHSVCPYKGQASYSGVRIAGRLLKDAAWCYPEPLEDALRLRGCLSFDGEGIEIEADDLPA
ncbi:MAG TPA: DUF427 domain-containing protein [Gammaproteobacteria bacterium]|nr:DUF427 domain-containing protein [Gammaproteobacteria bacterium]